MSRTSRQPILIAIVGILIFSCYGSAWYFMRRDEAKALQASQTYETLYFAIVCGEDTATGAALPVKAHLDFESISPYLKGSGPSELYSNPDRSLVICSVGRYRKDGLEVDITCEGYQPKTIRLDPKTGGVTTDFPGNRITVKLDPVR